MTQPCDFCSLPSSNLGLKCMRKISEKNLQDILEKESGGKQQKIGNKQKTHYDRYLRYIFNLGEGFENINYLALDKIRKNKDDDHGLSKLFRMGNGNCIFDYVEAANLLLMRSYPEIANGTQKGPIFIPETFLPSYTRGVDPVNFL